MQASQPVGDKTVLAKNRARVPGVVTHMASVRTFCYGAGLACVAAQ